MRGSLQLDVGEQIKINKPRDVLGISAESYRSVVGKNENDKKKFKQKLHRFGFEIVEISERDNRGKGRPRINPIKYIKRMK
mgnify:CR=1 FL=1